MGHCVTTPNGNIFCVNEPNTGDRTCTYGWSDGWLHGKDSDKRDPDYNPPLAACSPPVDEYPVSLPEDVHKALETALSFMSDPLDYHLDDLRSRGITGEMIKHWGFKQWCHPRRAYGVPKNQQRRFIADKVFEAVGDVNVPGFGKRQYDKGPRKGEWYRTTGGLGELAMPTLRPSGQIVSVYLKNDPRLTAKELKEKNQGKYHPLTCGQNLAGPKVQSNRVHCAAPPAHLMKTGRPVFLAEGHLKANITSWLLGTYVLGPEDGKKFDLPTLESYLRALRASEVVIAFDQDTGEKKRQDTEGAVKSLANELYTLGFVVKVATWHRSEGKGIDDFLAAGNTFKDLDIHSPSFRIRKNLKRDNPNLEIEYADPPFTLLSANPKDALSLDEQRFKLSEMVDHVARNRSMYSGTVVPIGSPPGVGKSRNTKAALRLARVKDSSLRAVYFFGAHKTVKPEAGDGYVRGRGNRDKDGSMPCSQYERMSGFVKLGTSWGHICKACPSQKACQTRGGLPGSPFYWSQYPANIDEVGGLNLLPFEDFFIPSVTKRFHPNLIVIDDCDPRNYIARERFVVTDTDLAENIRCAEMELRLETDGEDEESPLRPALPLLRLFQGFLRFLIDEAHEQAERPRGDELAKEFFRWCKREEGVGVERLAELARQAETAEYPNPFNEDSFEQATPGPKSIVEILAEFVLSELQPYREGVEGWNSHFYAEKVHGGALAYYIGRRYDMRKILDAYPGVPIIFLHADLTDRDELREMFPGREILDHRLARPETRVPAESRVHQDIRRRFSKTSLLSQNPSEREAALQEIENVLKKHETGEIGIVTFKDFLPFIKERFPTDVHRIIGLSTDDKRSPLWFGNTHSRNELEKARVLILLGTLHPNESDLIRRAQSVYHGQKKIATTEQPRLHRITDINGKTDEVYLRGFRDPRLQSMLWAASHHETKQGLFRIRLLNLDPPGQLNLDGTGLPEGYRPDLDVYAFTQMPLGVPIHRLITNEVVVPARVGDVLRVTAEMARNGAKKIPSNRALERAVSDASETHVPRRQVMDAIQWLNAERGPLWKEEVFEEVKTEQSPELAPQAPGKPPNWSTMSMIPPQTGGSTTLWRNKDPQPVPKRDKPTIDPVERNTS